MRHEVEKTTAENVFCNMLINTTKTTEIIASGKNSLAHAPQLWLVGVKTKYTIHDIDKEERESPVQQIGVWKHTHAYNGKRHYF